MTTEDEVFDQNYAETMRALLGRVEAGAVDIEDIRRELQALYRYEGLDWTGRGELKHAEIRGSIWAYQAFIHRWKRGGI